MFFRFVDFVRFVGFEIDLLLLDLPLANRGKPLLDFFRKFCVFVDFLLDSAFFT